jgi:beta-N-acetylhexosaminidase
MVRVGPHLALASLLAVAALAAAVLPGASPAVSAAAAPGSTSAGSGAIALSRSHPAAAAGSTAAADSMTAADSTAAAKASVAQLIGQKLVVRMEGSTPSAGLLERIRLGEIGGVILFGSNITTAPALQALVQTLRDAATAGGQPRLLVAVDQEGGSIRRIPWAPPTLSPPQMGQTGLASVAESQGTMTGQALAQLGIDVDFAPVADVPASTSSFLYRQGRTWSFSARTTSILANAFATGLGTGGVVTTMKHFPGLGYATLDTDSHAVTISQAVSTLDPGLKPYRRAIRRAVPMIMLSNAVYPAWDAHHAAGWSYPISTGLLRTELGFTGVTITDSLTGTAAARGVTQASLARKAARAGTDMLLVTGSEVSTQATYDSLVSAAERGTLPLDRLRASYARILALKAGLGS